MGNSSSFNNIINKKYHFTYQTKNNINGMLYVGRHSTDNISDGYIGSGKLLQRAIKKYGKNSFTMEILCFFDSLSELIEEEKLIVDEDWCNKSTSYNIVCGGSNPIMIGENNPSWKGGIKYIKKGRADNSGIKNPMYGKTHSLEAVNKIKTANIGKPNKYKGIRYSKEKKDYLVSFQKTCKAVSFYGFHFKSIRSCARELNITQQSVQYRIKSNNFKDCFLVDEYIELLKYKSDSAGDKRARGGK
jgi:group I intron endonuclease